MHGLAECQPLCPPGRDVTSGLLLLPNGPEESYVSLLGFLVLSHLPRTGSPLLALCLGSRAPYVNVLNVQENSF